MSATGEDPIFIPSEGNVSFANICSIYLVEILFSISMNIYMYIYIYTLQFLLKFSIYYAIEWLI